MTDHAVVLTTRQVLLVVVVTTQLVIFLPSLAGHPHGPAAWIAYGLLTSVLGVVAGHVAAGRARVPVSLAAVVLASSVLAATALPAERPSLPSTGVSGSSAGACCWCWSSGRCGWSRH